MAPAPPRRDCCESGFTLVELPVVIGLMVVLISILLPTLSAAKRRASVKAQLESRPASIVLDAAPTTAPAQHAAPRPRPAARVTSMEATVALTPRLAVGMVESQSIYACAFDGTF